MARIGCRRASSEPDPGRSTGKDVWASVPPVVRSIVVRRDYRSRKKRRARSGFRAFQLLQRRIIRMPALRAGPGQFARKAPVAGPSLLIEWSVAALAIKRLPVRLPGPGCFGLYFSTVDGTNVLICHETSCVRAWAFQERGRPQHRAGCRA